MVNPDGSIQPSSKLSKKGGNKALSKKQKARLDKGKERAVERSGMLQNRVKEREERKVRLGSI